MRHAGAGGAARRAPAGPGQGRSRSGPGAAAARAAAAAPFVAGLDVALNGDTLSLQLEGAMQDQTGPVGQTRRSVLGALGAALAGVGAAACGAAASQAGPGEPPATAPAPVTLRYV